MGEGTMTHSGIRRIAAALALASTVAAAGIGIGANQAHAARGIGPCGHVGCVRTPSITLAGGQGRIVIKGTSWSAHQWVELDIYAPVSSTLPPEVTYLVLTDAAGSFRTTYVAPGQCFTGQMEIQAIDGTTNTVITEYASPGCTFVRSRS